MNWIRLTASVGIWLDINDLKRHDLTDEELIGYLEFEADNWATVIETEAALGFKEIIN